MESVPKNSAFEGGLPPTADQLPTVECRPVNRRLFTTLSALAQLLLSLLYGGDLSEGRAEIRDGKLWFPALIDFEPWTNPAPTRLEKLQTLLGVTHIRRTSHPEIHRRMRVTVLRQYTVQDHYVVINLFWYRICFLFLPLLWLVTRMRAGLEGERRKEREEVGLCPSCGYDLRAMPGRCPECGLVPAAPPPPAVRGNER
jgi:hypothetical protein